MNKKLLSIALVAASSLAQAESTSMYVDLGLISCGIGAEAQNCSIERFPEDELVSIELIPALGLDSFNASADGSWTKEVEAEGLVFRMLLRVARLGASQSGYRISAQLESSLPGQVTQVTSYVDSVKHFKTVSLKGEPFSVGEKIITPAMTISPAPGKQANHTGL